MNVNANETTLTLPTEPLQRLKLLWETGQTDAGIIAAVRDIFGGGDGHLRRLDLAFHEHEWTPWSYATNPAGTRRCTYPGCGAVQHD